jgi:hypothetical protein
MVLPFAHGCDAWVTVQLQVAGIFYRQAMTESTAIEPPGVFLAGEATCHNQAHSTLTILLRWVTATALIPAKAGMTNAIPKPLNPCLRGGDRRRILSTYFCDAVLSI